MGKWGGSKKHIKFVNFGQQWKEQRRSFWKQVNRVLSLGKVILQEEVEKFERNLAEFVGTKYAVGLNSGTDALFLTLKLAGVKPGDEVITVGHTFHATVEAIHWNGATPVLVDVGPDSMMDVEKVIEKITPQTKAVIPVHLMGDMVDMKRLKEVCDERGITIIEDACQALGAQRDGKKAGSWGWAGCFSFYPAKILGAFGDAGAITTDDENLYNELKGMRTHYKGEAVPKWGFNSRLDNVQATFLNVKFPKLPFMLAAREQIAFMYDAGLKGVGDLILPTKREGRVYQDYIVRTKHRDDLAAYLKRKKIETMKNDYGFPAELPKPEATIELEKETLRLPCNPELHSTDIGIVIDTVRAYFESRGFNNHTNTP